MKNFFTPIFLAGLLSVSSASAQWAKQTSGSTSNLFGVKFYDANRGFAVGWVGSNSDILRTTDGGKTWKKIAVPNTFLFSVDMLDTTTIYVGGYDFSCNCGLIKKSTDGGSTWKSSDDLNLPETFGLYNVIMTGSGKGFASGYDGAIIRTQNSWGSGYTVQSTGTSTDIFRVLEMVNNDTGYAAGGENFGFMDHFYRMTNGTSWTMVKDYSGGFSVGNLFFVNGKTGFMTGSNGMPVIMKTTDGGDNWTAKYTGTNSQLLVTDAALAGGNTGYAITSGGEVLRTDDGGETWKSEQKFTSDYLSAIYVVNKDVAYAVGQNGVIIRRSSGTGIERQPAPEFGLDILNGKDGSVKLAVQAPDALGINLSITDIQGRTLENILPARVKGSRILALSGLQPGVYLLSASGERSFVSRKFVVVR